MLKIEVNKSKPKQIRDNKTLDIKGFAKTRLNLRYIRRFHKGEYLYIKEKILLYTKD